MSAFPQREGQAGAIDAAVDVALPLGLQGEAGELLLANVRETGQDLAADLFVVFEDGQRAEAEAQRANWRRANGAGLLAFANDARLRSFGIVLLCK